MDKKSYYLAGAVVLVALVLLAGTAFAFRGFDGRGGRYDDRFDGRGMMTRNVDGGNYAGGCGGYVGGLGLMMSNQAADEALVAGDYDAWVKAITPNNGNTPKILEKITKDNFADYAKAYIEIKDGNKVLTDLGVTGGFNNKNGK